MAKRAKGRRPVAKPNNGIRLNSTAFAGISVPRLAFAAVAALLAYLIVNNGFLVGGASFQVGILSGLVAGMLAGSVAEATLAAAAGVVVGLLLATPWTLAADVMPSTTALAYKLLAVVVAAALAAAAALIRRRSWGTAVTLGLVGIFLIGNLVVSVSTVNKIVYPDTGSTISRLSAQPERVISDADLFLQTFYGMKQGKSYYQAYRDAFTQPSYVGQDAYTVVEYREPLPWFTWSVLPSGSYIPWMYLAFALLAMVCAYLLAAQFVAPGYAVLGAAAVTVYVFFAMTADVVTYAEFWSFPFSLAGITLLVVYFRRGWRWALWAAAAAMAIAPLYRELSVFVPLVAMVAAFVGLKGKQRTEALLALGIAVGVFAVGYAAHWLAVAPLLGPKGQDATGWNQGGLQHLWLTINYATEFFALNKILPTVLLILAVVGAALVRSRGAQVLLLLAICGPLAVFLIVGGGFGHLDPYWGGYWGAIVMPIAFAVAPVGLGLGASRLGLDDSAREWAS